MLIVEHGRVYIIYLCTHMYVCMYMCSCLFVYICTYVYTGVYMHHHEYIYMCMHVCMYVCMYEYNVSICRYVTIAAKEPGTFLSQTLQSGVFLHEWLVM